MQKDEVFNKIKSILVSDFDIPEERITPESRLYEDLDLDSIDAVDLFVKMKPFLSGKIESEHFKAARTMQDVVDVLVKLMPQ
ncbi:MAG: acyl carrier protein [Treponemataceae bacterium]|nr:MAG: acyl carrier protein [Treponemataceae bacterium]